MITIEDLSTEPILKQMSVGEYDFETQKRVMPENGYPTAGSAQTFNYNGQPNDVRWDTDN